MTSSSDSPRVLVVDDREENLYYLEALLGGHGFIVDTARHGAEALARARQDAPSVVISDLLMPVMDGYTLLRYWKADARLKLCPFIVFTATYTDPEDERLALDLGADAFILKPAEPDVLVGEVRRVLATASAGTLAMPGALGGGAEDGGDVLTHYTRTLIRKLEEKSLQLLEANRTLEADIAAREQAADENRRLLADLGERVKELGALRSAASILQDDDVPTSVLLERIVAILPPAMQYPDIASACVRYADVSAATPGFAVSPTMLERSFATSDGRAGRVQVVYSMAPPDRADAPFLEEEAQLLDSLADILRSYFERRRAEDALRASESLLRMAGRMVRMGAWTAEAPDFRPKWSDETCAIHEVPPGFAPTAEQAISFYAPEWRDTISEAFRACVENGDPFDTELEMITGRGRRIWVRAVGEAVRDGNGIVVRVQGAIQDITDRKRSEEEARELADRFTTTLESITESFFTLDREWRFTYLNSEAERQVRRSRESLIGRVLWEEFPEAVGSVSEREYRRAMEHNEARDFEDFFAPLDAWFSVHAYPSEQGLAVYFQNITEQRASREEARVSQERFHLLSRATRDAIWDWDLTTNEVWWNEGLHALFGYSPEELGSRVDWASCVHDDDRERVLADMRQVVEGRASSWSGEYRFMRRDGTHAWVLDRGHIIRDGNGKAVRMIGGMTDLTEGKLADERMAQQAALIDQASDAIVVRDLDGRVTFWSRGAERVYGYPAETAIGRVFNELLRFEDASYESAVRAVLESGSWTGELHRASGDGATLTVDGRWTLLRDARGEPRSILSMDADITERRKLELQFLRAQRMESIGTLAGGIAHDLNNVLSPIMMSIGLLREDEPVAERRSILQSIEDSAHRGADMVRQVLAFARGVEGRPVPVDPVHLVHDIRSIVRDSFPKNIAFDADVQAGGWLVNADTTQLHQVLMNLCVNARDAMEDGGQLTVTVRNLVLDEVRSAMNPGCEPGPYVLIQVSDSGTGMPRHVQDRIFEPFFTTKEFGQGTGLGLSTVATIVKGHGGFIDVYSELGRGTRFNVYLPALAVESGATAMERSPERLPRGSGELVLVVDDEESIRHLSRKMLERFGYRVILAADGAEAVALYQDHGSEIAVVITDMAMPVMDGSSTIVALRSIDPSVRIIASSGNARPELMTGTGPYAIQDFIPKPYTTAEILQSLSRLLA